MGQSSPCWPGCVAALLPMQAWLWGSPPSHAALAVGQPYSPCRPGCGAASSPCMHVLFWLLTHQIKQPAQPGRLPVVIALVIPITPHHVTMAAAARSVSRWEALLAALLAHSQRWLWGSASCERFLCECQPLYLPSYLPGLAIAVYCLFGCGWLAVA